MFTLPGEDSIKALFHNDADFDETELLIFAVLYFFLACWTYGLGVPSGLFVPSLLTGAALGRLCGQLLQHYTSHGTSHPGTYALIGAAAVLAGMARITISLAVILMEATGNTQWSLPVLFTVAASKWAGDFFNRGLYDIHIDLKHVPMLEPFAEHEMRTMRASSVMTRDVKTLSQISSVRDIVDLLRGCSHNGFPVLKTGTRQLYGTIQRSILHHVLRNARAHGIFQNSRDEGQLLAARTFMPYEEVARKQPDFPSMDDVLEALHPEDYQVCLDLTPYTDRAAVTVQEHATLRRAFVLFRNIGLRHLPVMSCDGELSGLITRKELILAPQPV
jgi:chloride channel 7